MDNFRLWRDPERPFSHKGSLEISLVLYIFGFVKVKESPLSHSMVPLWAKKCSIMFRMANKYFVKKVLTASRILENHKVSFKSPVGSTEGPRLVLDLMEVSPCSPWYGCKILASIVNFLLQAIWPPTFLYAHIIRATNTFMFLLFDQNHNLGII